MLTDDVMNTFIFTWWIVPASCLFFFVFLGMGDEAMSDYRRVWSWTTRGVFRRQIKPAAQGYATSPTLPQ